MRLIDADALLNNINDRIENMTGVGVAVDAAYLWALIYDEINEAPTIEPSGDLISRQWLLDLYDIDTTNFKETAKVPLEVVIQNIKDAPSVSIQPKPIANDCDLISREDAIEVVCRTRCGDKAKGCPAHSCPVIEEFDALTSAETHEIRTETHGVCSDFISRADAIEAVCKAVCEDDVSIFPECDQIKYCNEIQALLALSSADRPKGEWIDREDSTDLFFLYRYECSVCGGKNVFNSSYCPNCGAHMR